MPSALADDYDALLSPPEERNGLSQQPRVQWNLLTEITVKASPSSHYSPPPWIGSNRLRESVCTVKVTLSVTLEKCETPGLASWSYRRQNQRQDEPCRRPQRCAVTGEGRFQRCLNKMASNYVLKSSNDDEGGAAWLKACQANPLGSTSSRGGFLREATGVRGMVDWRGWDGWGRKGSGLIPRGTPSDSP